MGGRAVYGECAVGCSESCYRGTVTGRGCREVRNGFNRLVLVDMVGLLIGMVARLENGAGCGCLPTTPNKTKRSKPSLT